MSGLINIRARRWFRSWNKPWSEFRVPHMKVRSSEDWLLNGFIDLIKIVLLISLDFIQNNPDSATGRLVWVQGPVSISEKTSFHKISSSLEAARFVFRIVRSLWNLTGTSAAVLPMCLSNFKAIRQFKVPISWLRVFTRSYEKTSFRYWDGAQGVFIILEWNTKTIFQMIWNGNMPQSLFYKITRLGAMMHPGDARWQVMFSYWNHMAQPGSVIYKPRQPITNYSLWKFVQSRAQLMPPEMSDVI